MKQLIFSLIGLIICTNSFGQMSAENARKVKATTLLIELTGSSTTDSSLVKAVRNYWSFTDKYKFIQSNDTGDQGQLPRMKLVYQELVVVATIVDGFGKAISSSSSNRGGAYIIILEMGKSKMQFGFSKTSELHYPDIVEAIKRLQFSMSETMIRGNLKVNFFVPQLIYSKQLKDKILLVDKQVLKKKLDSKAFKSIYPYDFKFTDKKEIDEAILQNDSSKAYIIAPEERVGIFGHFICDAQTGKIYVYRHVSYLNSKKTDRKMGISDIKKLVKRII
jgi:hypothetical protein